MENPIMKPQNEHCSKGIYNNVRQKLFICWENLNWPPFVLFIFNKAVQ